MSNAQMRIRKSTGALIFRMLRWALGIPLDHSDCEFSDENLAFHRSIQISKEQIGIGHLNRSIHISNAEMYIAYSTGDLRF